MIKRYWKAIGICICILLAIILGIKGCKIQTPEEVASNKVELSEDENVETSNGEVQNEVENIESGNDKEEVSKSEDVSVMTSDSGNKKESGNTASVAPIENKTTTPVSNNGDLDNKEVQETEKAKSYVNFSIDAKTVLNNMGSLNPERKTALGNNGDIYSKKIEIKDGESVFNVLTRTGINITHNGGYIKGINGLYEKDCGSKSGWMFSVNGEFLGKSASEQPVNNGDNIAFRYTCDFGKDLR